MVSTPLTASSLATTSAAALAAMHDVDTFDDDVEMVYESEEAPRTSSGAPKAPTPNPTRVTILTRGSPPSSIALGNGILRQDEHQPPPVDPSNERTVPGAVVSGPRTPASTATLPTVTTGVSTPATPGPDPAALWGAFTDQRAARAQATSKSDVGPHRPSMVELQEILHKHKQGILTYEDLVPVLKHSDRDVVGWLHMETGHHTKTIDVASAIASLLVDNPQPQLVAILPDVIKCERDLSNSMIRWGIASESALQALTGKPFRLRVGRLGSKGSSTAFESFTMMTPHVLDGFFLELPSGLQGRSEERLMFNILARLEPRFLWGSYTCVSKTTGLYDARYRLHFTGPTCPTTLLREGRMVEEIVFQGRRLRAYGKGYFFKDKHLARLDLDALGRSYGLYGASQTPPPPSTTRNQPPQSSQAAKKARTTSPGAVPWTEMRPKRTPRTPKTAKTPAPAPVANPNRPRSSTNIFELLNDCVDLTTVVTDVTHDTTTFKTITPSVHPASGDHPRVTTGEYTTFSEINQGTKGLAEMSLDAILAALTDLNTKASLAPVHLQAEVAVAVTSSRFNLASLVSAGRVDALCSNLQGYPVDFGVQLHRLFVDDRATFDYYVRQRLLHRWLRAAHGGERSFDALYTATFGSAMSAASVDALFASPAFSAGLEPMTTYTEMGDAVELSWMELEMAMAVYEVLLAVHAPLIFLSDVALAASTSTTVDIIASHRGSRCLSTATLSTLWLFGELGQDVKRVMTTLYAGDDDMAMRNSMSAIQLLSDDYVLTATPNNQCMVHLTEPRLVQGDLEATPEVALRG